MSFTVVYHWRLRPGRSAAFADAWSRGTRLIHRWCGSYGARLHFESDQAWSYARWPSKAARARCFGRPEVTEDPAFAEMQACIAETFPEHEWDIVDDQLHEPSVAYPPLTRLTPRLELRPLRIDDAWALHAALSDSATMRYGSREPSQCIEDTLDQVRRNVGNEDAECVAITLRDASDDALGWVVRMDRQREVVEIGFLLRPDVQGQGYAREAVGAVVEDALTGGLRRVYADVDPDNARAIRLLRALGFVEEGRLRAAWHTHIGVRDSLIFGRLATD